MISSPATPRPIIIDTDGGVDDALAIIMALKCDQIDVKAVTVLAGNIDVDQAAENVLRTIDIVQPKHSPLVVKGCEKPLIRPPCNAAGIHGADGLGKLDQFKNADGTPRYAQLTAQPSPDSAIDVLLKAAEEYGNRLTIVTLGPLTNIATALQRDPETLKKVGQIVIMGGAVTVPGNRSAAAEFNFFVDPDAAQMVMESGIPLTLVGLDVTRKVRLSRQVVEDYAKQHPSPLSQFIADCTGIYMAFHRDHEGFYGCYLHDPLALGVVIDPSLVSTKSLSVVVETQGKFTSGMSLADRRNCWDESVTLANVNVGLDVDSDRFLKLFCELIGFQ